MKPTIAIIILSTAPFAFLVGNAVAVANETATSTPSTTLTTEDFGSCSIDCEDQANSVCSVYDSEPVLRLGCYSTAFWGCMAGCTTSN